MKARKQWKDVRAYDASDLEQWMEQSLAGQAWFANETERPSQGVRSLDKCWSDWTNVAKPALDGCLFKTAIDIARDKFRDVLARPASGPMAIAGDSVEKALAFLSQLFSDPDLIEGRDRALVFDQIALNLLAGGVPYEELERRILELLALNDAPVWSIGGCRGVISKIDALFAIAKVITRTDLKQYFDLATVVLGEDDPALDLPEKERWAAASHGKQREFSGALREGISETLVLLAVHGNRLFKTRLGFDCEVAASKLVLELLEPLSTRKIEANERDLPVYAEAAPDTFLKIFERDLKTKQPASISILKPIETGLFGFHSSRVGLLWALEGLAWNPATLARVVLILGRLAWVEINDNYGNKPIASLKNIFRAWMPQTAANHDQRLKTLMLLLEKFPVVGWKICIDQFGHYGGRAGDYSHKPKWCPDGYGFGEPLKFMEPIHAFVREMVEVSLTRPTYTADRLCDLVERLHALPIRIRSVSGNSLKYGGEARQIQTLRRCAKKSELPSFPAVVAGKPRMRVSRD